MHHRGRTEFYGRLCDCFFPPSRSLRRAKERSNKNVELTDLPACCTCIRSHDELAIIQERRRAKALCNIYILWTRAAAAAAALLFLRWAAGGGIEVIYSRFFASKVLKNRICSFIYRFWIHHKHSQQQERCFFFLHAFINNHFGNENPIFRSFLNIAQFLSALLRLWI